MHSSSNSSETVDAKHCDL